VHVDGFVLVVKKKQLKAYEKLAKAAKKYFKKAGAVDYVEAVSDGLKPHCGVSFTQMMKAKKDEVVIFSWITYKTKKARDKANAGMMTDEELNASLPKDGVMPFDMEKMVYGGFDSLVTF
jgi:uncharacterized protein YbaA (DUF1428 family)